MPAQTSRRPRRLLTGGVAVGLAVTLVSLSLPAPASAGPASSRTEGVWRSDGYGSIIAVSNGVARHYATTAISCTPAGESRQIGKDRFAGEERTFSFRVSRRGAVQHLDGSVGDIRFSRLAALPTACTAPGSTGPLAVFDQFWTTYDEHYPFFRAKGIDWNAVRTRYRPQIRPDLTDDQLFDLLSRMIAPLGDAHTAIESEDRSFQGHRPGTTIPDYPLENRVRPFIERRDLKGPLTMYANNRIGYADLPGGIGYLRPISFLAYASDQPDYEQDKRVLDETLDMILTRQRLAGMRGLIIDLRVNGGGSDEFGLRLASRLTNKPFLAYLKRARNDANDPSRFTTPQPIVVRPAKGTRYTGPITILTGGSGLSAAETFTQAMMNRSPRPIRIGQNTQGVFSDVLVRTLPNGWNFIVPNEEFRTPDWRSFDGPGIPPDHRTPVFTAAEFAQNRDSAFDKALALLR
ncbi:S41 family peptidase [Kribbella deserti]|uniref:S41 family peptidase n=1 Tax=Kribbella deserti TaxID=1926257 RepID=A0ABV6QSK2_9ACTN